MAFVPCTVITAGLNGLSCEPNPGGVSEIYLTNFQDVTLISATAADYSPGVTGASGTNGDSFIFDIQGPAGATVDFFFPYTFRRNTASFAEDLTKDLATGSLFYTQTGTIVLDRIERVKRDELMLLDNSLVMVIAKHSNGTYWLYGQQDGMFVTTNTSTTGTAKTDANGYIITLVAEEPLRAKQVDPALIPFIVV